MFTWLQWCEVFNDRSYAVSFADMIFDAIFMLEVVARFVVCPSRLTFLKQPYNWIDFLAGCPVFLRIPLFYAQDETIHFHWFLHQWRGTVYETLMAPICLGFVPVVRLLKILR